MLLLSQSYASYISYYRKTDQIICHEYTIYILSRILCKVLAKIHEEATNIIENIAEKNLLSFNYDIYSNIFESSIILNTIPRLIDFIIKCFNLKVNKIYFDNVDYNSNPLELNFEKSLQIMKHNLGVFFSYCTQKLTGPSLISHFNSICSNIWNIVKTFINISDYYDELNISYISGEQNIHQMKFDLQQISSIIPNISNFLWSHIQERTCEFINNSQWLWLKFEEFIEYVSLNQQLIQIGNRVFKSKSRVLDALNKEIIEKYIESYHKYTI
ncbi:hypothetical protein MXB_5454 [Myxobolus squamalis]|nr:hypothetical protein MXB_5454 [Myxobolus squamalis]